MFPLKKKKLGWHFFVLHFRLFVTGKLTNYKKKQAYLPNTKMANAYTPSRLKYIKHITCSANT